MQLHIFALFPGLYFQEPKAAQLKANEPADSQDQAAKPLNTLYTARKQTEFGAKLAA
jgi:hypothetical protein